tara:strand:- start:29555 stop:31489 length:1935 start_codon:yes stop_codon:yes gene_type:complete
MRRALHWAFYLVLSTELGSGSSFLYGQTFTNQAPAFGIQNTNGGGLYGAAVSTADWDNNGWPDLTLGSSSGVLRTYRNLQGDSFTEYPLPWHIESEVKSLLWVDLDNDGDDDLFILEAEGRSGIVRNDGGGQFVLVSEAGFVTGLPNAATESGGASFGDMDGDGDLDLHICRYLQFPLFEDDANRNVLLRNDGDFQFTNVSSGSGIDDHIWLSFQSTWWDINEDGLQDLLVINDKDNPNAVYLNQGDGTFANASSDLNMDVVIDCMSLCIGDFDQDSDMDLFHTNTHFGGDGLGAKLLVQEEDGTFSEQAQGHGLDMDRFCWGAAWMDVDNDMDLDLFVTEHDFLLPYGNNILYQNNGANTNFTFTPFSTDVYDNDYLNSHVVATADFDRNGWVDFVVHNIGNHVVRMWMNGGSNSGYNSVAFGCEGTISNRNGIGAKMELQSAGVKQVRLVHAGENYLSQESEFETFGLGSASSFESMDIHWPSGVVDIFDADAHNLAAGQQYVLREGHSPCPEPTVEHVSCAPLWWPPVPEVHPSFELSWISDSGVDLSQSSQAPLWNLETGDFTMSATWNGLAMCDVHYVVNFEPLPADFDDDGAIGTSDLLTMLSSIGCTGDCIQDFNADSSVTVMDLLVFLTVLGQSCT